MKSFWGVTQFIHLFKFLLGILLRFKNGIYLLLFANARLFKQLLISMRLIPKEIFPDNSVHKNGESCRHWRLKVTTELPPINYIDSINWTEIKLRTSNIFSYLDNWWGFFAYIFSKTSNSVFLTILILHQEAL